MEKVFKKGTLGSLSNTMRPMQYLPNEKSERKKVFKEMLTRISRNNQKMVKLNDRVEEFEQKILAKDL